MSHLSGNCDYFSVAYGVSLFLAHAVIIAKGEGKPRNDGGIFSAGGRVAVRGEEILSTAMSADMACAASEVLIGEEGLFYSLEWGSGNFSGNIDGIAREPARMGLLVLFVVC
jgi:hypothetical protein